MVLYINDLRMPTDGENICQRSLDPACILCFTVRNFNKITILYKILQYNVPHRKRVMVISACREVKLLHSPEYNIIAVSIQILAGNISN